MWIEFKAQHLCQGPVWSEWSEWSKCYVTFGDGERSHMILGPVANLGVVLTVLVMTKVMVLLQI